jgi:hypothetical protein
MWGLGATGAQGIGPQCVCVCVCVCVCARARAAVEVPGTTGLV